MSYAALLRRAAAALLVCAALVTVCYFFVDRPVAFFVHDQHFNRFEALKWLTYLPVVLEAVAPAVLVLAAVRLARGPLSRLETTLFCAAVNLMATLSLKNGLKVAFGRYWPETWTHDNPSLIQDGAYGFHPFHTGPAYESFPSGHTARIFAVLSVAWVAYPKWRWLCVLACGSVVVGLVGMDYHFVGDVVAGAFLGSVTGMYSAHFFRLDQGSARSSDPAVPCPPPTEAKEPPPDRTAGASA
jgi:membrane-associated phospholipid phosphatase